MITPRPTNNWHHYLSCMDQFLCWITTVSTITVTLTSHAALSVCSVWYARQEDCFVSCITPSAYAVQLTSGSTSTWTGKISLSGSAIALLSQFRVNSASHKAVYWDLCYSLFIPLPLVSGMHSLIHSPMISISLHLFLNPDLKHLCTKFPTTNHSVTLTAAVIRLQADTRHVFKFV